MKTAVVSVFSALLPRWRAEAGFGFGYSIEIGSWGPLSLEIGLDLPAALLLGAAFLLDDVGFFSGSSRSYGSSPSSEYSLRASAERTEPTRVRLVIDTIQVRSSNIVPRSRLRIMLRDRLDEYERISLGPGRGHLQLREDGRLAFVDSGFNGYLFIHADEAISVFDGRDNLVMLVKLKENGKAVALLRRGRRSDDVVRLLLGASID